MPITNGLVEKKTDGIDKSVNLIDFESELTINSLDVEKNGTDAMDESCPKETKPDTTSEETFIKNGQNDGYHPIENGVHVPNETTQAANNDTICGDKTEIVNNSDVPDLNDEFGDASESADCAIDFDGIFDSLSAVSKKDEDLTDKMDDPVNSTKIQIEPAVQNDVPTSIDEPESVMEPESNEQSSTLENQLDDEPSTKDVDTKSQIETPEAASLEEKSCDESKESEPKESKSTSDADLDEVVALNDETNLEQDQEQEQEEKNETSKMDTDDIPQMENSSEHLPELDLFDKLRSGDTESIPNIEPMEVTLDDDGTEVAPETETHIVNKTSDVTDASVSLLTNENDNQENKENNLLEAMSESPRSVAQSCEGSVSSMRDDCDSNLNEFGTSSSGMPEENFVDDQNEFNDKNADAEISGDNSNFEMDVENDVEDIVKESESNDSEMPSKQNDVEKDLTILYESNSNSTSEPDKSAIEIVDDDDDRDGDAILITSDVSNSKISEEETVNEKRQIEDLSIENGPPPKRLRLSVDADSNEAKGITVPSEATEKVATKDNDDDIMVVEPSDSASSERKESNSNESPVSPKERIDENKETIEKLKTSNELEVTPVQKSAEIKSVVGEKNHDKMDTEEVKKEESVTKEPMKTELTPKPEEVEKRSIKLDFMNKFKTEFTKMTRKDLEELVLTKVVEAIVHKSEYSYLKEKVEGQEQTIQSFRTKVQELNKQYRDLEMVYARLKKDLEIKNQSIVTPIKITRAVGLQVCLQKSSDKAATPLASNNTQKKTVTVQKLIVPTSQIITRTTVSPATSSIQQKSAAVTQKQAMSQRQQALNRQQQALKQVQEQQRLVAERNRQVAQKRTVTGQSVLIQQSPQHQLRSVIPAQG